MRVKVSPMIRKTREVFLRYKVFAFLLGRVEAIQDNSNEQV